MFILGLQATPPVQYTGVPVNANSGAMGYPPWSVLPKYKVVHLHETTNPFTEIFTLPASLQQEKEGIAGDVNIPDRTRNDHKRMFIAKIKVSAAYMILARDLILRMNDSLGPAPFLLDTQLQRVHDPQE